MLYAGTWIFTDEYQQEKDENIAYHLNKRGTKLKGVFLSHLHSDHMAGIRELPHDIPYVIGKGEKCLESKPFHYGGYFSGLESLHEIDFSTVEPMRCSSVEKWKSLTNSRGIIKSVSTPSTS